MSGGRRVELQNEANDECPPFIGVNDSLVGWPTTLLVATGFIIDPFGFLPVFVGSALLTIAGIAVAIQLPKSGKKEQKASPDFGVVTGLSAN